WAQREEQQRQQLMNQGLDPDSEAYRNAMGTFGQQRNDAYSSAMNGAIGQGTAAGNAVFQNNLASQQANIANALRARMQPLMEMQQLQGFLGGQPQYAQDNSTLAGMLGSTGLAQNANKQAWDEKQAQDASAAGTAGGVMSGIGTAAGIAAMFF